MPDDAARSHGSASRGGAGLALVVLLIFMLLPMLYVLSVGPADYLVRSGNINGETVRTIYWPLAWLYDSWEPIQPLFEWYLELWK